MTTRPPQSIPGSGSQGGQLCAQRQAGRFAAHRRHGHRLIGHLPDSSSLNAHSPLHNPGGTKPAMAGLGLLGSCRKCWWSFITVIYRYLHYNSALGPLLGLGHSCPGCGEYLTGDSQLGTRSVLRLPWKSTAVNTEESLAQWVLVFPNSLNSLASEHGTSCDPPALGKAWRPSRSAFHSD